MRESMEATLLAVSFPSAVPPLLLFALAHQLSSFAALIGAALFPYTTTASAAASFASVSLSAIALPCSTSTPSPLLSVDHFSFGCRQSNSSVDGHSTFFLAVFFSSMPFGPAVWTANPARPISRNASLLLSSSSTELFLSDPESDSAPAWSLAFSASSLPPASITLNAFGNLVILDSTNSPLWQSFLHPLDLLLPGQVMIPGMKLVAGSGSMLAMSAAETIIYSAVMEHAGLAFLANFSGSHGLPYGSFSLKSSSHYVQGSSAMNFNGDYCASGINGIKHSIELQFSYDATQLFLRSCMENYVSVSRSITFGSANQTVDFLRLDPDGSIRGYKYDYSNATWNVVYDWFADNSVIMYGMCGLPNICGPYGICDHLASKHECNCPHPSSTHQNVDQQLFVALNKSDLSQGCRLANPLNCSAGAESHFFIELQGADYFNVNHALSDEKISISTKQECLASCLQNCSCKAAFYRADRSGCFQYKEILSIIGLANSTGEFNYPWIAGNMTQKVSYLTHQVAGNVLQAATLVQNSGQYVSNGSSSTNVLINYVGFLKVGNNSVQGPSPLTGPSDSKPESKKYLMITVGGTIAGFLLLGVTGGLFCMCCRKRGDAKPALGDKELHSTGTLSGQHGATFVHFTFAQLKEASGDFKCKLGVGGFGSVYKGTLSNGSVVAIKQLENAIRGTKEFRSQVAFLHSLNHPHIARLNGFCANGSGRLLISDYMSHGSLDAWIFNKPITNSSEKICLSSSSLHASYLNWNTRFSIALDVAKGLAFLHQNNLIHLNIKPQNILLDDKFVAKLSDYGLSRLMDQEEGCMIMHMRGTTGYMAPEWLQDACATQKSDVYSYGMVLMEMLGGRKNVDLSKERESWYFPLLAARMYKEGKVLEVLDKNLTKCIMNAMGDAECEQAKMVMQIAFWCISESPAKRPDMETVLSMLEGNQQVPEPPLPVSYGRLNIHGPMSDNHDHDEYYDDQSRASSPNCFNLLLASEPPSAVAFHNAWSSGGGQQDDCSLLLSSQS